MRISTAESTLIFLEQSPDKCPSANSRTIALFLRWQVFEKGENLLDLNNQATIQDVNAKDLKYVGDWNEMNSVNQFLSAVTTIHTQKDQSGEYVNICDDAFLREHQ